MSPPNPALYCRNHFAFKTGLGHARALRLIRSPSFTSEISVSGMEISAVTVFIWRTTVIKSLPIFLLGCASYDAGDGTDNAQKPKLLFQIILLR